MLPPPTTMPTSTPVAWTAADLLRDERAELGIDAVLALAEERLAGELEQDAAVARRPSGGRCRPAVLVARVRVRHSSSPSA